MTSGREKSIFQILQPERVDRVFVELGRRVIRQGTSGEDSAFRAQCDAANKALTKPEICLRCGSFFIQKVNYQYRQCKMHYKDIIYFKGMRIHSCCGKKEGTVGCVSCMHTSRQEMFDHMNEDPLGAFVEVSKLMVDRKKMDVSTEIITDYPRYFLSKHREIQIKEEKRYQEELKPEDFVYRINMVAIFPAMVRSILF